MSFQEEEQVEVSKFLENISAYAFASRNNSAVLCLVHGRRKA